MRSLKTSYLAFLILGCLCLNAQSVSPVPFSQSEDVVPAFSDAGPITLPAAHLQVDVNYIGGKKERGGLVVYDPHGHRHFWRYEALNSPNDTGSWLNTFKSGSARVFVAADKIVEFMGYKVTEHRTESNSLGDAVTTTAGELLAKLPIPRQRPDSVDLPLTGGPPVDGLQGDDH
jgi:hypothetical protein